MWNAFKKLFSDQYVVNWETTQWTVVGSCEALCLYCSTGLESLAPYTIKRGNFIGTSTAYSEVLRLLLKTDVVTLAIEDKNLSLRIATNPCTPTRVSVSLGTTKLVDVINPDELAVTVLGNVPVNIPQGEAPPSFNAMKLCEEKEVLRITLRVKIPTREDLLALKSGLEAGVKILLSKLEKGESDLEFLITLNTGGLELAIDEKTEEMKEQLNNSATLIPTINSRQSESYR